MAEEQKLQVLDVEGLGLLVAKLQDGTLVVGKAGSVDADKISGTIPLDKLPAAALERVKVVANDAARLGLTSSDVQNGDTVKVSDTGKMYFVKDDESLGSESAFEEYVVGTAAKAALADAVAWSGITDKPETFKPEAHNQSAETITSMTGYVKDSSESPGAIAATDTLNVAVGKLEKKADNMASGLNTLKTDVENLEKSLDNVEAIPQDTIEQIIAGTYGKA